MEAIAELLSPETLTGTCRECGRGFEHYLPHLFKIATAFTTICPDCSEAQAREDGRRAAERSKSVRAEWWKQICPPEFVATDAKKLPNPRKLSEVLNWQHGPRGLLLYGPTGCGKSRCAWELLRREYAAGRNVKWLDSTAGLRYASTFAASTADAQRWIDRLAAADLLLLDDVFKAKLTDSFEAALFSIVDGRTENRRPIIITCNDTGESLLSRMSPDRGEPMVRRLREYCHPIGFGA